jgi:hypothetical protein
MISASSCFVALLDLSWSVPVLALVASTSRPYRKGRKSSGDAGHPDGVVYSDSKQAHMDQHSNQEFEFSLAATHDEAYDHNNLSFNIHGTAGDEKAQKYSSPSLIDLSNCSNISTDSKYTRLSPIQLC